MVKRALILSFVLSLLSLGGVLYTPLEIKVRESNKIISPYWEEMEKILPLNQQKALSSEEWSHYQELSEKHKQWVAQESKKRKNSATTPLKAWQKKSSRLAPAIMLLWAVAFYFYFRHKPKGKALWVLTFPVFLTVVGLMSLLEGVLIVFVVLLIWFVWLIRGQIE